jgi:putative NADH-flavin reductase
MKIALIGATGNVGSRITAELVGRGHTVTAIVRNPDRVARLANVTAVKGDVMALEGLAARLKGHDVAAVPSTSWIATRPS